MAQPSHNRIPRPPVVTVMGHIDHGKSTLLDYIRKTKVTQTEAGGITQHISAYEVEHASPDGTVRRITFLDTPGHEAFQHLRSRGSSAADLAILVVAADDGVMPQTLEALAAITQAHIPYLVAISKIDKSNADVEKTKRSLISHEIYLEGMGGSIPFVPISSKTGEGISALLDLLLLAADVEELTGDPESPATGLVIESHCDQRRGISAVLVIKDGTLAKGEYLVAGNAYAPLRIIEDFAGRRVDHASFSSPIAVTGFSNIPPVGSSFQVVATKKEAVLLANEHTDTCTQATAEQTDTDDESLHFCVPFIIKADVVGSIEAIQHEIKKFENERTSTKVVQTGVGTITENDIKCAQGSKQTIVIGFNVGIDAPAQELAERHGIEVKLVRIIYDLSDWLQGAIDARRPHRRGERELARAKILKCFSFAHKTQTIGCRIESGTLSVRDRIILTHGNTELGRGRVVSLKSGKAEVSHVEAPTDCGAQIAIELEQEPVFGDTIVAFTIGDLDA